MTRFFFTICVLLLSGCSVVRSLRFWYPNIDDHRIFPTAAIAPSTHPFEFAESPREEVGEWMVEPQGWFEADTVAMPLADYLTKSPTTAFLVVRSDTILFEKYYRGYSREKVSQIFSASKSVTGLLTGIAVTEGAIASVHDPVTKYIPELAKKDPHWERLTVEHLLDMRSGFKFRETYSGFLSKSAAMYYGTNRLGKMRRMRFEREPGDWPEGDYNYQSATTAMLGLVVERATGRNLAQYLSEKVWQPMGMENAASWSLDDRRHRAAKADSGLNTTARDLAKIGRLYLKKGDWNGVQIVSPEWVERTVTPNPKNGGYQYQWYSIDHGLRNAGREDKLWDSAEQAEMVAKKYSAPMGYDVWYSWPDESGNGWQLTSYNGAYYALGLMGQVMYVDPARELIIVRLGEKNDKEYPKLMFNLAKTL